MTKMAAMSIYDRESFKNLLLQNQLTDFHETWYVAFGTPAHETIGKSENSGFFRNYYSL